MGDTVSGPEGDAEIVWIGHRQVDCARHPEPARVWPIRVRAGAFGACRPACDVLLSPDHCVAVPTDDGVRLIPIRLLVNGASILQERRRRIGYWHVELRRHRVLLAEGLEVESYLDTGNRAAFLSGGRVIAAHPDFASGPVAAAPCAPLLTGGPALSAVRREIATWLPEQGFALSDVLRVAAEQAGHTLRRLSSGPDTVRFRLGRARSPVGLLCPSTVPADFDGSPDERRLGMAVAGLALFSASGDRREIALDDPCLASGWHAAERHGGRTWRWTDGAALLPAALLGEAASLEVQIVGHLPWWRQATSKAAAAA